MIEHVDDLARTEAKIALLRHSVVIQGHGRDAGMVGALALVIVALALALIVGLTLTLVVVLGLGLRLGFRRRQRAS